MKDILFSIFVFDSLVHFLVACRERDVISWWYVEVLLSLFSPVLGVSLDGSSPLLHLFFFLTSLCCHGSLSLSISLPFGLGGFLDLPHLY